MTDRKTAQHRIGSGFGAGSTAAEVLTGVDLSGKVAIVTGGYSGIGLETTRALAAAGAHVVVPARRPDNARQELAGIGGVGSGIGAGIGAGTGAVEVDELDLGDPGSVAAFAERFLASGRDIDIVINSAGIMACPESRVGPGWEAQFGTNHLGHYVLVNLLMPAITRGGGARVISVSSRGHHRSGIRWDDVQFGRGYDKWAAYGQAKTANVLFAVHLDALARDAGVRAFALHPGGIMTPLQRHLSTEEMVEAGWVDENRNPVNTSFKTPEQGAATQVWAATATKLDGLGGVYCEDCDIAEPAVDGDETGGVRDYAVDPGQAARLWALSAELTGVDAFARV
ncbi:MAG TPA: SDR family NAD(P)-dependent oxidoreductase [Pseudonocardia sp.]